MLSENFPHLWSYLLKTVRYGFCVTNLLPETTLKDEKKHCIMSDTLCLMMTEN